MRSAPVCYVYGNNTLGDGLPFFELHTATRDGVIHRRLHEVDGTQPVSGFAMGGYTLSPAVPANANNQWSLDTGIVADEDIRRTTSAVAASGPYHLVWRDGETDWTWDTTPTLPLKAGTYVQYNRYTGATWTLTDLATNNWVNYWVFVCTSLNSNEEIAVIPGQAVHTTLGSAQAESVSSQSWGTLPFQEIAPLWRVTFRTSAGYGTTGKCRIESVTRIVGTRATITAAATTSHNVLSGLQGGAGGNYFHIVQERRGLRSWKA